MCFLPPQRPSLLPPSLEAQLLSLSLSLSLCFSRPPSPASSAAASSWSNDYIRPGQTTTSVLVKRLHPSWSNDYIRPGQMTTSVLVKRLHPSWSNNYIRPGQTTTFSYPCVVSWVCCHISHVTYHTQLCCHISHITYHMSHITYHTQLCCRTKVVYDIKVWAYKESLTHTPLPRIRI